MSTTVVWTDEDKPGGVDERTFDDSWLIVTDGGAEITNHVIYQRKDGGTTTVVTIKEPPPRGPERVTS